MNERKYKTKEEVLKRGREAIGKSFRDIDQTYKLGIGKGAVGSVVEESWFGYNVNSDLKTQWLCVIKALKIT